MYPYSCFQFWYGPPTQQEEALPEQLSHFFILLKKYIGTHNILQAILDAQHTESSEAQAISRWSWHSYVGKKLSNVVDVIIENWAKGCGHRGWICQLRLW